MIHSKDNRGYTKIPPGFNDGKPSGISVKFFFSSLRAGRRAFTFNNARMVEQYEKYFLRNIAIVQTNFP